MKTIKFVLILFLFLPFVAYSQQTNELTNQKVNILQNAIYRIDITQPFSPEYEAVTLSGVLERRLKGPLTILPKIGIGASVKKFGSSDKRYQTSLHLYSAAEGRYYFSLNKRTKSEKPLLNYSLPYFSIEQTLNTNPIALINQTAKNAFEGSTRTCINFGYQKQIGKLQLGTFIGLAIFTKDFSIYDKGRNISPLHGGILLGYILN